MKKIFLLLLGCLSPFYGYGEDSFASLLQKIKAYSSEELKTNQQREEQFETTQQQRTLLVNQAKQQLEALKKEATQQQMTIDTNDTKIAELEAKLEQKSADVRELFAIIRQTSGELKANLETSITSVHFPQRAEFLQNFSTQKEVPTLQALQKVWLLMLEELDESRKISKFAAPVLQKDGTIETQEVIRIGLYGAISEEAFLNYSSQNNTFAEVTKPPPFQYQASAKNFDQPTAGFVKIMLDPTRGQLLQLLAQKPNWLERIKQGGIIGYLIIVLSAGGMLLALLRYGYLTLVLHRIKKQAQNFQELSPHNPLGRIALTYQTTQRHSQEQKEVILEEAILKETPKVSKYNSLIKLLATISPLLGLLGTVTGMIITFQSITLFGTSDPKLMAGGISTALVTTLLGLCAAIPLLFAYTLIAEKTKTILDVLEYQSVGLIAKEIQ